ncbi:hypothetical protein LTR53_014733 [Teratosphaeriaceae sp. CCFEE 6253]|nr:hypothetical protein LTR53_014733 [Teratosphaeriaceae sp. CCFEE 6253]
MASPDFTPAMRIRELNDISSSVAETLRHMGETIRALSPSTHGGGDSADARKSTFDEHLKAAYEGVQAFQARMKRQAYALEEAGIIAPDATAQTTAGSQQQQQPQGVAPGRGGPAPVAVAELERITNGGLGQLDVGWLNSRGNKVGVEKEAELLQEAESLLREELKRKSAAIAGD